MMKAKVAFGEDIRHWHYPTSNRYQDLVSFVEKTLKLDPLKKKDYYFQFEDAEMDKVTIGNERDLLDAFECAEQEKRPSLKIFVVQGSIHDIHEGTNTSSPAAEAEVGESGCTEVKSECEREQRNWCEVALEFVLDEKVNVLFPELIRRVVSVLREEMKNGKEASLVEVVSRVLEEKTFEPIVRHELYQTCLKQVLPLLLVQGSCFTPILLSLNEAAVGEWVADMLKLVTMTLGSEDHGLWNMHMDAWRQHASNVEAVHHGVKCDGCGVTPIRGARYKCAVCSDYDLCEKCESSKVHCTTHPLVKISRPMCQRYFGGRHFQGLGEIMGRRCQRRQEQSETDPSCRFGRWHGRRWNKPPCWMRYACKEQPHCQKEQSHCKKEKGCEREAKKKCKLQLRKEKLMQKLTKINSKLNVDEEMKVEPSSSLEILCICKAPLIQTTAMEAYHKCNQVVCDKCERQCSPNEIIFHCPIERSPQHRSGYDICGKCANKDVVAEMKVNPEPKSEPVVSEILEKPAVVEKPSAVVEKPSEVVKKPVESVAAVVDPFANFQYAAQARNLLDMGFSDNAKIMSLLVSKNGNVEQVVMELLSQ